jgi:hypothetical protein
MNLGVDPLPGAIALPRREVVIDGVPLQQIVRQSRHALEVGRLRGRERPPVARSRPTTRVAGSNRGPLLDPVRTGRGVHCP